MTKLLLVTLIFALALFVYFSIPGWPPQVIAAYCIMIAAMVLLAKMK